MQPSYIIVMNDVSVGMNDYWLVLHKTVITTNAATVVNKATVNKITVVVSASVALTPVTSSVIYCVSGVCNEDVFLWSIN